MCLSLHTADILQANDSLTQVINLYRQLVKGEDVSKDSAATPPQTSPSTAGGSSSALVDLMGLSTSNQTATQNTGLSLLDDELMSLGKQENLQLACKSSATSQKTLWVLEKKREKNPVSTTCRVSQWVGTQPSCRHAGCNSTPSHVGQIWDHRKKNGSKMFSRRTRFRWRNVLISLLLEN